MPAAPGAQLDSDVMSNVFGSGNSSTNRNNANRGGRGRGGRGQHQRQNPQQHQQQWASAPTSSVRQPYDAYVVLDFEATCQKDKRIANQEIIELPFVVVDPDTLSVVAEFQRYVRPVANPTLTAYCTEMTGITQATVDQAEPFVAVYAEAKRYLSETLGLGEMTGKRSYCVVTCGDWDLKTMLPAQLRLSGAFGTPASLRRWCNLKTFIQDAQPPFLDERGAPLHISGMPDMLLATGLELEGRHHSGIDDCRNIARVLIEVMRRGHVVRPTYSIAEPLGAVPQWRARPESTAPWGATVQRDLSAFAPPPSTFTEPQQQQEQQAPPTGPEPRRLPAVIPDLTRDAVAAALAAASAGHQLASHDVKTISKAMSHVLRHGADKARVTMSVNGYVALDDLLRGGTLRNRNATAADVAQVVADNDKQRFRLVYDAKNGPGSTRMYVCASQGHSLEGVKVDMKVISTAADAADTVVHGTYHTAFQKIRESGYLSVMTRQHIHFAKGMPSEAGVISGMRASAQVVLFLDVAKCLEDGIPLLESASGVLLTAGVGTTGQLPLKYIKKAVDRKTGASLPLCCSYSSLLF